MHNPEDLKGYLTRNAVRISILAAFGAWVIYDRLMTESAQVLLGFLAFREATLSSRRETLPYQLACPVLGIFLGIYRHEDALACILVPALATIVWGIRYSRPLAGPPEKVAAPSIASMRFWVDVSGTYQAAMLVLTALAIAAAGIGIGLAYGVWVQTLLVSALVLDNPAWSFFRSTPWMRLRSEPAEWPSPAAHTRATWGAFYLSVAMSLLVLASVLISISVAKASVDLKQLLACVAGGIAIFVVWRALYYRKELRHQAY